VTAPVRNVWWDRLRGARSARGARPEPDRAAAGFAFGQGWARESESESEREPTAIAEPPRPGRLAAHFEANAEGPGIWKWRHYFEAYERHLAKFVGRSPRVVEIGVYSGGSLEMWKQYFGTGCEIIGVDIEEACRAYAGPSVEIVIGDQADPAFWAGFVERFDALDVVIDDGGHLPEQQIATLEALLPRLRDGGVYICEDVTGVENEFQDYCDGLARNLNAEEWISESPATVKPSGFQTQVHSIHRYPFLVAIERTPEPVAELIAPRHGTEWQPFFDGP